MSVALVTSRGVRLKFPELADQSDAAIELAIEEAERQVDDTWTQGDIQLAIMYLAAHFLAVTVMTEGSGTFQVVQSETIGRLTTAYASIGIPRDPGELETTVYGRRFLDLARRNFSGGLVV